MRTVTDNSKEELANTLATEIAQARQQARPISRLTLNRLLQTRYSLNPSVAEKFVDRYCDEKEPGIPTFLSSEFGTPYLKVLAILNAVLAAGFLVVGIASFQKPTSTMWIWLFLGVFFLGAATICYAQSLRRTTTSPREVTRFDMSSPSSSGSNEPVESASTGPLQPRN